MRTVRPAVTMNPQRIQRQRAKGWRMPDNTVYVGRGSMWGNPFAVLFGQRADTLGVMSDLNVVDIRSGEVIAFHCLTKAEALSRAAFQFDCLIRGAVDGHPLRQATLDVEPDFAALADHLHELRGKNLACWCPLDQPCHADVLLELANATRVAVGSPQGSRHAPTKGWAA